MKIFKRITSENILESDRTKDYYWVTGNRNNPPVILLAGFTGTHSDLLRVAKYLKIKYFVIIPDLPGWGKSPRTTSELTLENYALFLKSILDSLKIKKVSFCGHCMGALISIEFAYQFPEAVKELILISTPYLDGTISQALIKHIVDLSIYFPKTVRPLFYFWRSRIFGTPIGFYVIKVKSRMKKLKLIWHFFKVQSLEREDSVEENFVSIIHFDYNKVKKIHIPIHLIQGGKDVIVNMYQAQKFHTMIPNATFDIIPSGGHMPPLETPKDLSLLILKYLDK